MLGCDFDPSKSVWTDVIREVDQLVDTVSYDRGLGHIDTIRVVYWPGGGPRVDAETRKPRLNVPKETTVLYTVCTYLLMMFKMGLTFSKKIVQSFLVM